MNKTKIVSRLPRDVELAVKAMNEAIAEIHEESRRTGKPIPVWRDGKVVWIIPEKETPPPRPPRRRATARRNGKSGNNKK